MNRFMTTLAMVFCICIYGFGKTYQFTDGTSFDGKIISSNSTTIMFEDSRGNIVSVPSKNVKPEIPSTNFVQESQSKDGFHGKMFLSIQPNLFIHGAAIGFEISEWIDLGCLVDYGIYESASSDSYGSYDTSMSMLLFSLMARFKFGQGPLKPYIGLSGGVPLYKSSTSTYGGAKTENSFIRDMFLILGRAGFGADYRINEFISVSGEYGLQGGLYFYNSSGVEFAQLGFTYAAAAVNFYF